MLLFQLGEPEDGVRVNVDNASKAGPGPMSGSFYPPVSLLVTVVRWGSVTHC